MKILGFFIAGIMITCLFACGGNQEEKTSDKDTVEATSNNQTMESTTIEQVAQVGCAKCQLGLPCDECKLGVKINDEAYIVEGIDYNAFAEDNLCTMVKNAMVAGKIENKEFKATKVELVADAGKVNEENEGVN